MIPVFTAFEWTRDGFHIISRTVSKCNTSEYKNHRAGNLTWTKPSLITIKLWRLEPGNKPVLHESFNNQVFTQDQSCGIIHPIHHQKSTKFGGKREEKYIFVFALFMYNYCALLLSYYLPLETEFEWWKWQRKCGNNLLFQLNYGLHQRLTLKSHWFHWAVKTWSTTGRREI